MNEVRGDLNTLVLLLLVDACYGEMSSVYKCLTHTSSD